MIFATAELAGKTLNEVTFDLLIFDDAQLYTTNEVGALQYRQVIVAGDDFALSNQSASILSTALNAGCEQVRLGMIHTTEDDDMNALLDAIYPGESFHLPHSKASNFFEAIFSGGFFNEKEHYNEIEAEKVLHLLNRIEKLPNSRYPSVGIVCSTVQQRDLISSLLLKIKQMLIQVAGLVACCHFRSAFCCDKFFVFHLSLLLLTLELLNVTLV